MIQTHLGPWQKTKAFLNFFMISLRYSNNKKTPQRASRLRGVNHANCEVKLHGEHPTAESRFTVSILPQSQASRWASYHRVRLHGEHPTAESSFTVSILPQSQASQWASYRRVKLVVCIPRQSQACGVHPTAESSSTVCIPPQSRAPRCATYHEYL